MRKFVVQVFQPRDHFYDSLMTIEEWLSKMGHRIGWTILVSVFAALGDDAALSMDEDGIGQARVGYDPHTDQPFFLLKIVNNGTTYIVSESGLEDSDANAYTLKAR